MADDDGVGYGKPPRESRWKSGQSGNPKGRPKEGGTGLLMEVAAILSEPVTAKTPEGGSVRLAALEATYLAMCKKALKGDDAALYQAIKMMLEIVPAGEQKQSERAASIRRSEAQIRAHAGNFCGKLTRRHRGNDVAGRIQRIAVEAEQIGGDQPLLGAQS